MNSPDRRQWSRLVLTWAIWCATVLILATAAEGLSHGGRDPWQHTLITKPVPPLARWDSGWYYWIATKGLAYDPNVAETPVGFYPLYPILVRGAVAVLHTPVFWTGIALSLLCLLGALFFVRGLLRTWSPTADPDDSLHAVLFFPTAFFFAAFYTESLFLLTTSAALWGARRGRWLVAAAGAAASGLVRFNGALILLPVALCAGQEAGWRLRGLRAKHAGALLAGVAGAAAYPTYLWYRWGDPLLYVRSKTTTGTQGIHLPTHLLRSALTRAFRMASSPGSSGQILFWLDLGCLLGFSVLVFLLFRRRLLPEAVYGAATLLLYWSTGTLDGIPRYVLALFPCFSIIGDWLGRRPTLAFAYRYIGASLSTLLIARFVQWKWVA